VLLLRAVVYFRLCEKVGELQTWRMVDGATFKGEKKAHHSERSVSRCVRGQEIGERVRGARKSRQGIAGGHRRPREEKVW